ncbi:MAG: VOC family protein [Flavobacteriales bacterium]|nr:VOC family protein [Flavobacteriales bacterium]
MKKDSYASAITTILVVSDIKQSTQWYTEVLGAELYRAYGGDSVVLQFLGQWLLLVTSGAPTADKPATYMNPPKNEDDMSHAFTLRVEDCEASYVLLKGRGASFITPPVKNGGETRCFFRDPDGHLFEISAYAPG